MKRIISIYINSLKLGIRFNRINKTLKILLKESDCIDKNDVHTRKQLLMCMEILHQHMGDLLKQIKELKNNKSHNS